MSTLHGMCKLFKSKELSNTLDKLSKRDFLRFLPFDVTYMILAYMDYSSLSRIAAVSHTWHFLIASNDKFWMKVIKNDIKMHEPLMQKKLISMTPYNLFINYKKKVNYFKNVGSELQCPIMDELGHSEDLGNPKELHAGTDGHLVIGYTMEQPHDIFNKYQVSDVCTTKILSSIKTIRSRDCRVNDNFLFCSTNIGRWVCYSWKTTKEVYSLQTYDYGYDEHRFVAFAEACDKCPVLALFNTNRME